MNRAERFLTAVNLGCPDRVPMFDFLFQQPLYEALIGHRPESYNGRDAVACAVALDHDGVWLPFGGFSGFQPKMLSNDTYVDEWGTTYVKNAASWPIDAPVDYPIKSRQDLASYRPPDPTLPGRDSEIVAAREANAQGLALLGGVGGPFCTAWSLMGYEQICMTLYDDPDLLTSVLNLAMEYQKEAARLSVAAGCRAMWVSEDLGFCHQGFCSLDHFREYVLPPLAELIEYIANLGVPVLLHSCGHIKAYLDDLAQTRISAIHPLQRTAGMDLREVKEKYGKRFCIIGNIDSSRTLPYGSPEEVAKEVREAIAIAAPGGGYVLASDHSLHDGIPIANVLEMRRVGLECGSQIYKR